MNAAERPLAVLAGPTASGKTALALKLEIPLGLKLFSADAMQCYRGMDIGTSKPLGKDAARFSLLDLADPGQGFSAGRWAAAAAEGIEAAWGLGKLPLLCGGSGLYLRALLRGLSPMPAVPGEIRKEVAALSLEQMSRQLLEAGPAALEKLDVKNPRRLARALEVFKASGKTLQHWQAQAPQNPLAYGRLLFLVLDPGREALAQAIHARSRAMVSQAWISEAVGLAKRHGREALLSTGAIGYLEMLEAAEGRLSLEEARAVIATKTLQYARRQRTWFKSEPEARLCGPEEAEKYLREFA